MNYFIQSFISGELFLPKGELAEIGVWKGATFKEILDLAAKESVMAHAFDSFKGMDTPTDEDKESDGTTRYPRGSLSVDGVRNFMTKMTKAGFMKHRYKIWSGYIPSCFEKVPLGQRFSLVRIDVDQYKPTLDAARWAWDHLKPRGVLLFHDFFPDKNILASKAIKEFLAEPNRKMAYYSMGIELFVRKG